MQLRLFTLPSILFYYTKMLFFPVNIAFGWYWVVRTPTLTNFWTPLFISSLLFLAFLTPFYIFKKNASVLRIYFFFFIIFLLNLFFISQVFPLDLTAADRWYYMPLFGLLGMIGTVVYACGDRFQKIPLIKMIGVIVISLILILFAYRDILRTSNWKDSYELCSHDISINTTSYIVEYCISNELYNKQRYLEAKKHAERAIDLYPQYFLSWYTLGKAYYALNQKEKAEEAFKKTLSLNDFALGSEELSLILVYEKKPKEAKEVIQKYLKILPNSGDLWYALALANYLEGNTNGAVNASEKAYRILPNNLTYKVYIRLLNKLPIKF